MSIPYPSSGNSDSRTTPRLWERIVFVVLVLAAVAYCVLAATRLYTLNKLVGDAKDIQAGGSLALIDKFNNDINLDHNINIAFLVAFWVMYALFIVWMAVMNSRFKRARAAASFRKAPAYQVWRVGVIVSLVVYIVVARATTANTSEGVISFAHQDMVYMGVRLLVGLAYLWCAFSMYKLAQAQVRALAAARQPFGVPGAQPDPGIPPVA